MGKTCTIIAAHIAGSYVVVASSTRKEYGRLIEHGGNVSVEKLEKAVSIVQPWLAAEAMLEFSDLSSKHLDSTFANQFLALWWHNR